MRSEHPVPAITPAAQQQFDFAAEGVLAVQRCEDCGALFFPPSTNCPQCLSTSLVWQPVSGRGRVWSWIVMHQPYLPSFQDEIPYVVAMIDLDEGPSLMSTLVDIPRDKIAVDLPVQVRFEPFGTEGRPLPVFAPVTG